MPSFRNPYDWFLYTCYSVYKHSQSMQVRLCLRDKPTWNSTKIKALVNRTKAHQRNKKQSCWQWGSSGRPWGELAVRMFTVLPLESLPSGHSWSDSYLTRLPGYFQLHPSCTQQATITVTWVFPSHSPLHAHAGLPPPASAQSVLRPDLPAPDSPLAPEEENFFFFLSMFLF